MKSFIEFINEDRPYGDKLFDKWVAGKENRSDYEIDTKREEEVLHSLVNYIEYNGDIDKKYIQDLRAMQKDPKFKEWTKPDAKVVYRGRRVLRNLLTKLNFKEIKSGEFKGYYEADDNYSAHKYISSWTKSPKIARDFSGQPRNNQASVILSSKVNSDFIFSTKLTSALSDEFDYEEEIIHITGKPLKVKVIITPEEYERLMSMKNQKEGNK